MKLFLSFFSLAIVIISCGSPDSSTNTSSSNARGESKENAIDPAAKSDSKGVGKFSSVETGLLNEEMAKKGEAVFNANCTACHRSTPDRAIGPGLKGITARRTPEWIMNMIVNPQEMTEKDPVAKALLAEYGTQMVYQGVTDDQARQILEYFRKNDQ